MTLAALRTALAAATLAACHAAAQTTPRDALSKYLQSFEAAEQFTPQTRSQRLHAYLLSMAGPATLVAEAGAAGFSQAIGSPWQWGDGAAAYAKRFVNDMAYNAVRYSLSNLSGILLNEDDRYFASKDAGKWRRTRHAIASVFIAHKPDGQTVFAVSSVIGIAGASAVSRAWSPPNWQTASATTRSIGISVAGAAGFNVVREFLPEIVRRLR